MRIPMSISKIALYTKNYVGRFGKGLVTAQVRNYGKKERNGIGKDSFVSHSASRLFWPPVRTDLHDKADRRSSTLRVAIGTLSPSMGFRKAALTTRLADQNGLKNLPRQIFSACVKFGGNPCRDVETLRCYTHTHTHTLFLWSKLRGTL